MLPSLFVVTVCGGRDTTVSSKSSSSAQSGRLWQGVSQRIRWGDVCVCDVVDLCSSGMKCGKDLLCDLGHG